MKIRLVLIATLFAFTFESFTQVPGYREDTSIPTFDINFLTIRSSDQSKTEFKFLKTAKSDFLEAFPNPDKDEDFYFEIGEVMARLIAYETSEFYFLEGKLSGLRLQDSKFSIGNGKSFIKVGDHYSLVEKIFPSYKKEFDKDFILIPISNGDIISDESISIVFDLATGKIIDIIV